MILYISAYPPFLGIPKAGHRLATQKVKQLSAEGPVVVLSFLGDNEDQSFPKEQIPPNVEMKIVDFNIVDRLVSAAIYPQLPFGMSVRKYVGKPFLKKLIQKHQFSKVFVDFSQAADLVPNHLLKIAELRVHDIQTQLFRRSAMGLKPSSLIARLELMRSHFWERKMYRRFRAITALSKLDADDLMRRYHLSGVKVENPIPTYVLPVRDSGKIIPGRMMFFANFDRPENVDAARQFILNCLPNIRKAYPPAHFALVGAGAGKHFTSNELDGVEVVGYVDDPLVEFSRAACAVAPIRLGAGVKIKVLETIASQIPTVATDVGAEGIDQNQWLHLAHKTESFIEQCVLVLSCREGGQ